MGKNLLSFLYLSVPNPSLVSIMQVTNSATIVDYFPEAFIAESDDIKGMKVTIRRFIKRVYFRATGQRSYSVVNATDAKYDWQSRINNGATVTYFNTYKMPRAEYMPMSCWSCHLSKIIFTLKWWTTLKCWLPENN